MKSLIFAAALLAGTAAIAQTETTMPPAPTDPALTTAPATPDPTATPATAVSPGNTAPERDARGIPVVSDPAEAPAGFNAQGVSTGVGGPMVDASQRPTPQAATQNYPACSRTVTDNCVQTYERGRSPQ